jgi:hypothetical protein
MDVLQSGGPTVVAFKAGMKKDATMPSLDTESIVRFRATQRSMRTWAVIDLTLSSLPGVSGGKVPSQSK